MWYLLSQRKGGGFHREKKDFRANVIRYYQGGREEVFAEEGKEDAFGMGDKRWAWGTDWVGSGVCPCARLNTIARL
jgi:predicted cupin superfamily sugar epimerase